LAGPLLNSPATATQSAAVGTSERDQARYDEEDDHQQESDREPLIAMLLQQVEELMQVKPKCHTPQPCAYETCTLLEQPGSLWLSTWEAYWATITLSVISIHHV
jgi:hypothetical protein